MCWCKLWGEVVISVDDRLLSNLSACGNGTFSAIIQTRIIINMRSCVPYTRFQSHLSELTDVFPRCFRNFDSFMYLHSSCAPMGSTTQTTLSSGSKRHSLPWKFAAASEKVWMVDLQEPFNNLWFVLFFKVCMHYVRLIHIHQATLCTFQPWDSQSSSWIHGNQLMNSSHCAVQYILAAQNSRWRENCL